MRAFAEAGNDADWDRLAELWVEWDNLAMLTQLGLFPPPVSDDDGS